jgi:NADH-quinone oxidoreductase subunit C
VDGGAILERLRARLGSSVVDRAALAAALTFCHDDDDLGFDVLMDLTAVDYQKYPGREDGPRFEVVYHLYSLRGNHRVRIKVRVDEDDAVVPTAVPLWPIADWLEREVWDMFGVRFEGHPNLRRLLMYEEFVGHPLRKDYPINRRQPLIGPRI